MGDVYFSMEIRQVSVISNNSIDHIGKCSNERKTVEFLHLCPKKVEVWMQENRCSCFLYDTKTGVITPSNTTASGDGNSAAVWFSTDKKSINGGTSGSNACTFKIHRDFVTNQGTMVSNSEGAESTLFQRGVYRMPTLFWQNGIVSEKSAISTENFSINCQVETFENGDSLFELSTTSSDNDTFICFILWPNGTHEFAPIGAHVKCMPQNTTFNVKSHIYVPNKQTPIEIMQVIISISVIGIVILLALAAVLFMRCKRRVEKILKDNKKVPEILNEIMKNEHPIQENKMDMEIEKYDKYDALAKSKLSEAHQEIANQNYNSDDFAESRVIARESGKFNSGESLKSNDSGVVSDLYVEKRAKFSALALSTSIDEDGGELPLGESPSPKIRSYSRTGVYSKRSLFSKVSSTSIESRDTGCGSDSDLDSFDAEDSLRTPYFDKRHFAEKNLEIET